MELLSCRTSSPASPHHLLTQIKDVVLVWVEETVCLIEPYSPREAFALKQFQVLEPNRDIHADFAVHYYAHGYKGMYVQIKTKAEKISVEEEVFALGVQLQGYSWRVATSAEEVIEEIISFLCLRQYAQF